MYIVDFDKFIRLPSGTVFAPFASGHLEDHLAIKIDYGRDIDGFGWSFNGIMPLEPWNTDCVFDSESVKATFEVYDGDNNDYSIYDQFLIFEDFDINRLIKVLQWAKKGCPDDEYDAFDEM